jgi:hypothetical protein
MTAIVKAFGQKVLFRRRQDGAVSLHTTEQTVVGVEITRPANTTAYAAKDVVADNTTANLIFTNAVPDLGGSGVVTGVQILTDQTTNTTSFILHLYHTAPTAIADNAAFTLLWAERTYHIGTITLAAAVPDGAVARAQNFAVRIPFNLPVNVNTLYGVLETVGTWTPASAQILRIEISVES